jgi:xanthine/CO dehydrogenase XdhC/CoxF family maturation factor
VRFVEGFRAEAQAVVEGNRIVMREDELLARMVEAARKYDRVPDLYEACGGELDEFLEKVAGLVARGAMVGK